MENESTHVVIDLRWAIGIIASLILGSGSAGAGWTLKNAASNGGQCTDNSQLLIQGITENRQGIRSIHTAFSEWKDDYYAHLIENESRIRECTP